MRGSDLHLSYRTENVEGIKSGYGARGGKTVERLSFVRQSEGVGDNDEEQWIDEDFVVDTEQLFVVCSSNASNLIKIFCVYDKR